MKKKTPDPESYIGYMCGVAWQHETGATDVTIYPTAKSLKMSRVCHKECGIVKVKIIFEKWVEKQHSP